MIYPGTNSIYFPDICLLFMNFIMNFVQSNLSLGYFYALIVNIFGVFVFPVSVFFFQLWRKPSMPTSITSRFVSLHLHIYTSTLYSIPSILMTMLALRKRTIKDYKEKIYIPVHSRMRKKKSDRVLIIYKSNVLLKDKKLNCNMKKDMFVTLHKFIIVFLLTIFR